MRAFAAQLLSQVDTMGKKIQRIETVNEQLTHEIALLKRHKFAKRASNLALIRAACSTTCLSIL